MRPLIGWVLAVACLMGADGPQTETDRERNARWIPTPGDEVELWTDVPAAAAVWVATDFLSYCETIKSLRAKDKEGLEELEKKGVKVFLPLGTKIRVLEVHDYPTYPEHKVLEVRITSGDSKGKKVYIPADFAAEFVKVVRDGLPSFREANPEFFKNAEKLREREAEAAKEKPKKVESPEEAARRKKEREPIEAEAAFHFDYQRKRESKYKPVAITVYPTFRTSPAEYLRITLGMRDQPL